MKTTWLKSDRLSYPVHNHRFALEAKLFPERVDLLLQNAVFVVQIRYVGHHEVEIIIEGMRRSAQKTSYVFRNSL